MYGRLINGGLEYAPINYKLVDNRIILNFNKNEDIMRQYGYKNVIDIVASCNKNTQYVQISGYDETDEAIIINYEIIDLPDVESIPTIEELIDRVETIENQLLEQTTILSEEVNKSTKGLDGINKKQGVDK